MVTGVHLEAPGKSEHKEAKKTANSIVDMLDTTLHSLSQKKNLNERQVASLSNEMITDHTKLPSKFGISSRPENSASVSLSPLPQGSDKAPQNAVALHMNYEDCRRSLTVPRKRKPDARPLQWVPTPGSSSAIAARLVSGHICMPRALGAGLICSYCEKQGSGSCVKEVRRGAGAWNPSATPRLLGNIGEYGGVALLGNHPGGLLDALVESENKEETQTQLNAREAEARQRILGFSFFGFVEAANASACLLHHMLGGVLLETMFTNFYDDTNNQSFRTVMKPASSADVRLQQFAITLFVSRLQQYALLKRGHLRIKEICRGAKAACKLL